MKYISFVALLTRGSDRHRLQARTVRHLETHRKSAREYRSVSNPEQLSKSAAKEKETP